MLIELLEIASNNALQHDLAARQGLAKLQGKTLTLEIRPMGQKVSICPRPHGLEFSQQDENTDVTLSATVGALIKIGRDGLDDAELEPGELDINGDPIVGQRFARVLAQLNIDWEGLLAEHLGETPAVLLSSSFGQAKAMAMESRSAIRKHIRNLLTNEWGLIAEPSEIMSFLDDVDILRADTDRLQTRIQHVRQKL